MSIFSSYKKIFLLGFIVVILVAIPFSVYIAQQRQRTTAKAVASTTLSFDPVSPTAKVDDTLTLDIVLDPGVTTSSPNQVSFVKLSITYDATKFAKITDGETLTPNLASPNTLTSVLEDPVYTLGKATISLSIGADPTRVVTTKTKIAILKLKALSATSTPSKIEFNTAGGETQVLSIAGSDGTSENVLSSAEFATVTIASSDGAAPTSTPLISSTPTPTPTPAPGFGTVSKGLAPVCSSLNVDKSTIGTAPYSLTFTAVGNDPDSIISTVSFNFGDVPVQILTSGGGIGTSTVSAQLAHTYSAPGVYTAYAILTDSKGNLSPTTESCTKTITINSATAQITPIPTLPPTGPGENILGIGIIGAIFTIVGTALFILL